MILSSTPCSSTVVGARASWKTGSRLRNHEMSVHTSVGVSDSLRHGLKRVVLISVMVINYLLRSWARRFSI